MKEDVENGEVLESQNIGYMSLVASREARGPATFAEKKWLQEPFRQVRPLATSKEYLSALGRA